MKTIFENWKTTLSGLVLLTLVGLLFWEAIPRETFDMGLAVAVSLGLMSSQDAGRVDKLDRP